MQNICFFQSLRMKFCVQHLLESANQKAANEYFQNKKRANQLLSSVESDRNRRSEWFCWRNFQPHLLIIDLLINSLFNGIMIGSVHACGSAQQDVTRPRSTNTRTHKARSGKTQQIGPSYRYEAYDKVDCKATSQSNASARIGDSQSDSGIETSNDRSGTAGAASVGACSANQRIAE